MIYEKMAKACVAFLEAKPKKTGKNKFSDYNYFTLDDIEPPLKRVCEKIGIFYYVTFTEENALLTVVDTTDGTQFTVTSPYASAEVKGCQPIQNLGAVQTYLRRYLLMAAFGITEPDVLEEVTGKDEPKKAKANTVTPKATSKPATGSQTPEEADKNKYIMDTWTRLVTFFGYDKNLSPNDNANVEARNLGKKTLADKGITDLKAMTIAQADDINREIVEMEEIARQKAEEKSGPENFEGDVLF